jgi:hypothetical protein
MMKRILLTGALTSFIVLALHPAEAAEGAWCFAGNFGFAGEHNCQFDSFEQCRRAAGRSFCTQNPRWPGWWQQGAKPRNRR